MIDNVKRIKEGLKINNFMHILLGILLIYLWELVSKIFEKQI